MISKMISKTMHTVLWHVPGCDRQPLLHCVEASPVNKKPMAYQLTQEIGGGSSHREKGTLG